MKRLFDVLAAGAGLLVAVPFLLMAAAAVKIASPGPALYVARRIGRDGVPFGMFKLRTMHVRPVVGARITGPGDPRIFPFGRFLRASKLDEMPQLVNVLRGEMSIVGPRPEDPDIVREHYTDWMRETLRVRPGLTSPGALYGTREEKRLLSDDDPEGSYVRALMPAKLAVEYVYLQNAGFLSDLRVVALTIASVAARLAGLRWRPRIAEVEEAKSFLAQM